MQYLYNQSLINLNTFHMDVRAEQLVFIHSLEDLRTVLANGQTEFHILGGGSNLLLTQSIKGLLLVNRMKGIEVVSENEEQIVVKFNSGEVWHDCVMWAVDRNYGGIENLSLIPGSMGAAPIQNIGAYGVELKDVFVELEALNIHTGSIEVMNCSACQFGYRESIFKHLYKDKYFIVSITLGFKKNPEVILNYGHIQEELRAMGCDDHPTIKQVSKAVIRIRQSKLPNPDEIGNAGSFFKNPVIDEVHFKLLQQTYPNIPNYTTQEGVKIPAGWLIEQLGWKGFREGDYGVHAKQALVLVNYGHAKGEELFQLSEKIIASVKKEFNITLHREVNIW